MIKMEYLLEEGKQAPENSTIVECEVCKRKFAIPAGADLLMGEKICAECADAKAKAEAAEALKLDQPTEKQKALGE